MGKQKHQADLQCKEIRINLIDQWQQGRRNLPKCEIEAKGDFDHTKGGTLETWVGPLWIVVLEKISKCSIDVEALIV